MPITAEELASISVMDLPSAHFEAIGRISVNYAAADMMLVQIIHDLAKVDTEVGHAFTAHMVVPARLNTFLTLVKLQMTNNAVMVWEAERIAVQFESIASKRAEVIHATWEHNRTTGVVSKSKVSARRTLVMSLDKHPVEEISALVNEIKAVTDALSLFHFVNLPWRGPLPVGKSATQVAAARTLVRMKIEDRYHAHLATLNAPQANKARKRAHAEASRNHPKTRPRRSCNPACSFLRT